MAAKKTSRPRKIPVNLALQGGGAHGAYTWGVLDRLLDDEEIEIAAISGTSAGAMNAAMLVNGFAKGGREGAKQLLRDFWKRVSDYSAFSPMSKSPFERWMTGWNLDKSPAYQWFDLVSRVMSPYEFNPLNINPLKDVLDDMLDIKLFESDTGIKLFVTATHVASGQARVFGCHEVTTDVLLASSCIPFMFQAVEVDGEHYWDGGYMGNPAIWPLIYHSDALDVILVQINPIHNDTLPKTAPEIIDRLNEITFNSSLIAEMRAVDFVSRLIHDGRVEKGRYKDMRMHLIYASSEMHDLNASSKLNTSWSFFQYLFDIGRNYADGWLKQHKSSLGIESTLDIRSKFLCGPGLRSDELVPVHKGTPKKKP